MTAAGSLYRRPRANYRYVGKRGHVYGDSRVWSLTSSFVIIIWSLILFGFGLLALTILTIEWHCPVGGIPKHANPAFWYKPHPSAQLKWLLSLSIQAILGIEPKERLIMAQSELGTSSRFGIQTSVMPNSNTCKFGCETLDTLDRSCIITWDMLPLLRTARPC